MMNYEGNNSLKIASLHFYSAVLLLKANGSPNRCVKRNPTKVKAASLVISFKIR